MFASLPLLLACANPPGGEPDIAPARGEETPVQADAPQLPPAAAQRAARGAPGGGEPWTGPWSATAFALSMDEGALALGRTLQLQLEELPAQRPATSPGQLALIWIPAGTALESLTRRLEPGGLQGGGDVLAILGPGDEDWSAQAAAQLPWLGLAVADPVASLSLWANPALLTGRPRLGGWVAARQVAEHYRLPWYAPTDGEERLAPGLDQHLGLAQALPTDPDPRIRAAAARAGAPGLEEDPDAAVRLAVAATSEDQALLAGLAQDREPLVRARAADRLHDVAALVALSHDASSVVRLFATHSLSRLASQGAADARVARQLQALASDSPDAYQRWKAAWGLGYMADSEAVLVQLLDDADVDVRREAARSLGRLASSGAVPELVRMLDDPNSFLRRTAAQSLGEIGDPRALQPLRQAAQDQTRLVAAAAARALTRLGHPMASAPYHPPGPPRSAEEIRAMANSPDATLRKDLCKFLGGSAQQLPLLEELSRDADGEVRKSAVEALGWSKGNAGRLTPSLADPDPDVVVTALDAMRRTGEGRAASIAPLLEHGDAEIRLRATEALAAQGACQQLRAVQGDADERIRAALGRSCPQRIASGDKALLPRRAAAAHQDQGSGWQDDPDALVRWALPSRAAEHGWWWARGVIAREDELLHLRFSFHGPQDRPPEYRALRPPVVREYGHPDRG